MSIIHLWAVTREHKSPAIDQALERSFFSPLYLAQALGAADVSRAKLLLVSNGLQQVFNEAVRDPERAVLLGPAGVISKECQTLSAAQSILTRMPRNHTSMQRRSWRRWKLSAPGCRWRGGTASGLWRR